MSIHTPPDSRVNSPAMGDNAFPHANNTRAFTINEKSHEMEPEVPANQALLADDLEAQTVILDKEASKTSEAATNIAAEYLVSTKLKLFMLGLYFAMNLALTIYNKAVLGSFRFPWLVTALHTSSASIGCYVLMLFGWVKLTRLSRREHLVLTAFSFLFTINIAISNVSLAMVSVPFHQIARSTCPIATIAIYRWAYGRTYATATYMSLIPVVVGVALSTYGDYYFTIAGALMTFLGVVLASVKTVATNRLMTGSLALPALEVLFRMSPLAAAQSLVYAYITGELDHFLAFRAEGHMTRGLFLALLGNGVLAFFLNITSFQANKLAGALTITVCANIKQCLTILLGVVLFNVQVGLMNGFGMVVTLAGAAWYSKVELDQKAKKAAVPAPVR